MSFVDINGLAVDVSLGDWDRADQDLQSFERSEGFTLEGVLYAPKRAWSAETPLDTSGTVDSLRQWIKGRGHYWTFERVDGATTRFNRYSSDGGPGFGTNLTSTATSKFGTWAGTLASGVVGHSFPFFFNSLAG